MLVGDVAWIMEQAHEFCHAHGLGFDAYPMHEVSAHPQAAEILRVFADHVGATCPGQSPASALATQAASV